jgi:uncharacterized protein (TIGR03663 family)
MEQTLDLEPRESILDVPVTRVLQVNWEVVAYALILVLACLSRYWDLGSRAVTHDESLHALYSWKLYAGEGYKHDPMMHGPFLFHINALAYFLFGASDFTARIMPALFGVTLVVLPLFLRRWLGRAGALAASFMLLISPVMLYRSRTLRHDMFVAVWTFLMFIALFQYLHTRRNRWLYVGAAAVALALATKEVAYIHGFIGVTFLISAMIWESGGEERARLLTGAATAAWGVIIVLATLIYRGMLGPLTTDANGTSAKTLLGHAYGILFLVAGYILAFLFAGVLIRRRPIQERLGSVAERIDRHAVLVSVAIFVVIFSLLYTTFFTNGNGLYSGTIGAVSYWLAQQDVQRGTQPWYYYMLLLPLYEFLPLVFALGGTAWYLLTDRWPKRGDGPAGRLFLPMLVYWSMTAFLMYTWAGEKMPWLLVHIALPVILLAGRVVGDFISAADWRAVWDEGGPVLALLLIPTVIVLFVWVGIRPFRGMSLQDLAATTQWIAALVVLFILLWAVAGYVRRMGARRAAFVGIATAFVLLSLLTVRFSYMANYVNDELAKEYLVYAHATPDDKMVVNEIQALAERLNQTETIKVSYDAEVVWPFEWYVRDLDNRNYFGEIPSTQLDAPVVLVGTRRENEIKPYLGDRYVRREYKMRWWPDEGYKDLTVDRIVEVLRDPARRRRVWNVIWRRKYDQPLSQWPHVDRFALYVRKDVVPQIWQYGAAAPELAQVKDEYAELKISLTSDVQIGSLGAGASPLDLPKDVGLDAEGNVYVSDIGNHRIQVFTSDGQLLREWGSQGSSPGQFNEPWGLAVDGQRGFVYVADTWNHRVEKFDLDGNLVTEWGLFADTAGQASGAESHFWGPRDVAVDGDGNVYVTDTGNKRIQKFDADGNFLGQWGGAGAAPGQFSEPVGIAVSHVTGDIYVADTWNRRIQRFDASFNPVAQWFVQGWDSESVVNKPYLALDADDNVYVTDPENYRMLQFNIEGDLLTVWGDFGTSDAQLNLPTGIAVDAEGRVWVADSENDRVLRFPAP